MERSDGHEADFQTEKACMQVPKAATCPSVLELASHLENWNNYPAFGTPWGWLRRPRTQLLSQYQQPTSSYSINSPSTTLYPQKASLMPKPSRWRVCVHKSGPSSTPSRTSRHLSRLVIDDPIPEGHSKPLLDDALPKTVSFRSRLPCVIVSYEDHKPDTLSTLHRSRFSGAWLYAAASTLTKNTAVQWCVQLDTLWIPNLRHVSPGDEQTSNQLQT